MALSVTIYKFSVIGSLVVQPIHRICHCLLVIQCAMALFYSSSVKENTNEESFSLNGDYLGHLGFVSISPRPLTSSWCENWFAMTRHGDFGAVGSLEIFLIV